MRLLIVTGMSGSGKSVTLKMLEDCGYESLDNIPHAFLNAIAGTVDQNRYLAVGANVSGKDFSPKAFIETIETLKQNPSVDCSVVFVNSDDDVLIQRLEKQANHHPILPDRTLRDGVKYERELLAPLRDMADLVIDTSDYQDLDLRKFISSHFARVEKSMSVVVTSFSFRRGVPREADFMFDVRMLQNPHYVPELKALTGLEQEVGVYIEDDPDFQRYYEQIHQLMHTVLPRQVQRKQIVTVAIGCTGGRHRSVHVAQKLGRVLKDEGFNTIIRHRDII